MMKELDAVFANKPDYQKQALDLYGIKIPENESRSIMTIVREAYLDFYSKSLQPEYNHNKYAYSKRMNEEQKDHYAREEKIFRG